MRDHDDRIQARLSNASGLYQFLDALPGDSPTGGEGDATNPKHAMVNGVDIGLDIFANQRRPRLPSGQSDPTNLVCETT